MRGLAASKELTVETFVDADTATVVTDAGRVKQLLYNYMSNAIKFTLPGGRVIVRITPESAAMFRIDVEDTGVGISPADLGKLFVEFHQIDASAAKAYQGTGLGLALTKRLAEALGGRVAVRSAPGVGSTFSAILPRAMTETDERHATSAVPVSTAGAHTVMIVDDDPVVVRMVEATLRERGYRSRGFTSAVDALHAAVADPPAVAIVDLLMPALDGFGFIDRLRSVPAGHDVPIIVWSVKDLDADDRRRLEGAAVSIVSKGPAAPRRSSKNSSASCRRRRCRREPRDAFDTRTRCRTAPRVTGHPGSPVAARAPAAADLRAHRRRGNGDALGRPPRSGGDAPACRRGACGQRRRTGGQPDRAIHAGRGQRASRGREPRDHRIPGAADGRDARASPGAVVGVGRRRSAPDCAVERRRRAIARDLGAGSVGGRVRSGASACRGTCPCGRLQRFAGRDQRPDLRGLRGRDPRLARCVGRALGILATRSTMSITPANALSRLVGDDAVIGLGSPVRGVWTDLSRVSARPSVDLTRVGVAEYRAADGTQSLGAVT